MEPEELKAGMAFRSCLVEEDIFLFAFPCTIIKGDGLFRRFNRVGAFVENEWYRFHKNASHLQRVEDCDFVR